MTSYYVYALRSWDDEIIYVGQTTDLDARIRDHRCNQPWADEIVNCRVLGTFDDEAQARLSEADRIRTIRPRYNIQYNRPKSTGLNLNRAALKVIRERSGRSKTSLAELAGLHPSLIYRLEAGQRNATPSAMRKIANALDVPLHALLGASDSEAVA